MYLTKSVSICAPVYNEQRAIGVVLESWKTSLERAIVDKLIDDYEIVLCDDGSIDGTLKVVNSLNIEKLHVIRNTVNQGAGISIKKAIAESSGNFVITIDSDGQFKLDEALNWFSKTKENEIVLGYRRKTGNLIHRFGSKSSTLMLNIALGSKIPDAHCMLKLIPGNIARSLDLRAVGLNYSGEMTVLLTRSQNNIRWELVSHRERIAGKSSAKVVIDGFKRFVFQTFIIFENKLIKRNVLSARKSS